MAAVAAPASVPQQAEERRERSAAPSSASLARLADKPLIFQEAVVTKPRRVKICDKKENTNKCTYDAVDDDLIIYFHDCRGTSTNLQTQSQQHILQLLAQI
jgi:hypothetical protein